MPSERRSSRSIVRRGGNGSRYKARLSHEHRVETDRRKGGLLNDRTGSRMWESRLSDFPNIASERAAGWGWPSLGRLVSTLYGSGT